MTKLSGKIGMAPSTVTDGREHTQSHHDVGYKQWNKSHVIAAASELVHMFVGYMIPLRRAPLRSRLDYFVGCVLQERWQMAHESYMCSIKPELDDVIEHWDVDAEQIPYGCRALMEGMEYRLEDLCKDKSNWASVDDIMNSTEWEVGRQGLKVLIDEYYKTPKLTPAQIMRGFNCIERMLDDIKKELNRNRMASEESVLSLHDRMTNDEKIEVVEKSLREGKPIAQQKPAKRADPMGLYSDDTSDYVAKYSRAKFEHSVRQVHRDIDATWSSEQKSAVRDFVTHLRGFLFFNMCKIERSAEGWDKSPEGDNTESDHFDWPRKVEEGTKNL